MDLAHSPWVYDPVAASTQFSQNFMFPAGHYGHLQSAQVQNNPYAFRGLDEGFFNPPHMDAQPFSNAHNVDTLNPSLILPGLHSENGAHRDLAVDFQSNNNAGLEACSTEAYPQGLSEVSVPIVDMVSGNVHDIELQPNNRQQCDQASQTTLSGSRKRKRKRDSNWTTEETSVLVDCKEKSMREIGSRFSKGKPAAANWDAISEEIKNKLAGTTPSAKTGDQCRLRWDTLVKSYQKISSYCKNSNKEFTDLTEEERGELKLATTLSEDRWYQVIHQFCRPKPRKSRAQKRDDLTGDSNGCCSPSSHVSPSMKHNSCEQRKTYCEQQVTIPNFSALGDTRRSTLLDLVNGSIILADINWVSFVLSVADTCQWLSIMQNRSPRDISWDVNSLVKKKLVYKGSREDGKVRLDFLRLRVYAKFVTKVASKNPDFDTYERIWGRSFSIFKSNSLPQRITTLTLGNCQQLVVADLRDLPKLRCLVIVGCAKLEDVTGWENLGELGWLVVEECPSYHKIPNVRHLPSLKAYFISQVEFNSQFPFTLEPGVKLFVRLCRLEIYKNQQLKESGDLSSLKCLQVLRFRRCNALSTIRGLKELYSLTTLDLAFCCILPRLPYIGHLKALTVLDIFNTAVEEIKGLEELVSLEKLDCTSSRLKWLPDLRHLPQLQSIGLRETPLVKDPSSFYFGKDKVEFYGDEKRRMEDVDIGDVSDSEHKHSEYCGTLYFSDSDN